MEDKNDADKVSRTSQSDAGPAMPGLPEGYDGVSVAKGLLRSIRAGGLGTLSLAGGFPFTSLVNVATDYDGQPILLMSGLSAHTKNLAQDDRASLLLVQTGKGDPLAHPRLTLVGHCQRVTEPEIRARLRSRFLARHPKSALYVDFPDFGFFLLKITSAHLNGGFAKAADYTGSNIVTDLSQAGELIEIEPQALAHMNEDHPQSIRLYATKLAGEKDGAWRVSGIDPEGLDLAHGDLTARITFPRSIHDGAALRAILSELAQKAREKP